MHHKTYLCSDKVFHYKSEIPKPLRPFIDYIFSSGGFAGDDFLLFSAKYKNAIRRLLPENYTIHSWHKGHYYISGVLKTPDEKFIYISIPDVRYFPNEWFTNILYRTMEHDKDWTGGCNMYTNLTTFTKDVSSLYK